MKTRIAALAAVALTGAIALAGCAPTGMGNMPGMGGGSSGSGGSSSSSKAFNSADVTFAQMMIPHHKQAVQMADMLLKKEGIDARVVALAQRIKDAQSPEITTMTGWLKDWGKSTSMSGMSGMSGMSDADMSALENATGTEASKLFLTQMTAHHKGAIAMAKTQISDGKFPDAVQLANDIVKSQTAEIDEMTQLLATL
ncbi:MAG: DUF305 domain-containing protein [Micrococcales bacterium]|nr:DUF305 domain-containing protein [Micrococcales bacterium]